MEVVMEQVPQTAGFTNVDASQGRDFFIEFLDARTGIQGERAVKELVLSLLALEPNMTPLRRAHWMNGGKN
jgi:hypothetical protein